MSPSGILAVLVAIAADGVAGTDLPVLCGVPDLPIALLCLIWSRDPAGARRPGIAWLLGLGRDFFSVGPAGVWALAFMTLSVVTASLRSGWLADTAPARALSVFAAVLAAEAVWGAAAVLQGAGLASAAGRATGAAIAATLIVWAAETLRTKVLAWSRRLRA